VDPTYLVTIHTYTRARAHTHTTRTHTRARARAVCRGNTHGEGCLCNPRARDDMSPARFFETLRKRRERARKLRIEPRTEARIDRSFLAPLHVRPEKHVLPG